MGVPSQVSQAVCGIMNQLTSQESGLKTQYQMARSTHAKTSLPTGELAAAASHGRVGRSQLGPVDTLDPAYNTKKMMMS